MLGDVRRGSKPLDDFPRLVAQRHGLAEKPVILIVRAAESILDLVWLAGLQRVLPAFACAIAIIGMNEPGPSLSMRFLGRRACEVVPAAAEEGVMAYRVGSPETSRR